MIGLLVGILVLCGIGIGIFISQQKPKIKAILNI